MHVSPYTRSLVTKRVNEQMMSTITVSRGTLGALDESSGLVAGLSATTVIYSGPARIWQVNGSGVLALGEGQFDTRQTFVSIPITARPVPRRDDLIEVIEDDLSDTDLDTRYFRVLEVDGGGYIGAARKLTCTSWYPSRYWEGEQ